MKAHQLTLGLALLSLTALAACGDSNENRSTQDSTQLAVDTAQLADTIPYRLAERYFAAADTLPSAITTAEELNHYLGMATTMDARPTEIDFAKEFVIPVALPETDRETEILPVALRKDEGGSLVFTYRVRQGSEARSFTIRPFVAVIVSRDYLAPVQLVQEK